MQAVGEAFRTGTFDGKVYSGTYGDLGAVAAAILLHREARSDALLFDPTASKLREPILSFVLLLRSFEHEAEHCIILVRIL